MKKGKYAKMVKLTMALSIVSLLCVAMPACSMFRGSEENNNTESSVSVNERISDDVEMSSEVIAQEELALERALEESRRAAQGVGTSRADYLVEIEQLKRSLELAEKEVEFRKEIIEKMEEERRAMQDDYETELLKSENEIIKLNRSIREFEESTKRERVKLFYNMGCIYRAIGEFEKAKDEFLKALKIDESDPGVHYNLGILYDDHLKDRQSAKYHFEKFLELAPNDKDASKVIEWLAEPR